MKKLLVVIALLASPCYGQLVISANLSGVVNAPIDQNGWQSFKVNLTQNVTFNFVISPPAPFPAQSTLRVIFVEDATGGRTVTFASNILNPCAITTAPNATTACQFTFDGTANVWQGIGGGAGGSTNQFSVKTYGAIGDTKASHNCTTATSSKIVTNTDNPWTAADVGKFMEIVGGGIDVFTPARKIASFQSAGQVTMDTVQDGSGTPGGSQNCKWFTQDDTAAWQAAVTAAKSALASKTNEPFLQSPTLAYPTQVYCPPGGYTVSSTIFYDGKGTGSNVTQGIGLIGDPSGCIIYPTATFVPVTDTACTAAAAGLINTCNTWRSDIENINVEGHNIAISTVSNGFLTFNHCKTCFVKNVTVNEFSTTFANTYILYLFSASGVFQNLYIQNGGAEVACRIESSTGLLFENNLCSNHGQSLQIISAGGRGSGGGQLTLLNETTDECIGAAGTLPCTQIQASAVNYIGGTSFGGVPEIMSVDGTSQVYLQDHNLQQFGAGAGNVPGILEVAGSLVEATGSTLASNGTSPIVSGPSTATFVDVGGNTFLNCLSGTCNKISGTNFATNGFSGGIVPSTSLTHTYPQPFLPALPTSGTALNIVAFTPSNSIMVKNFTITAGNTPTCATPPTFQISNGTQSFTQTFASAAQISGPFTPALTLFPGGTQVTLSITTAAYSCTTAPTNMNWSIEWQSAVSF